MAIDDETLSRAVDIASQEHQRHHVRRVLRRRALWVGVCSDCGESTIARRVSMMATDTTFSCRACGFRYKDRTDDRGCPIFEDE